MTKDIKKYFAALLLLMPMLLTGCFKEWNYTGCPVDDNLELRFRLVDVNGSDVFAEKINTIDVMLFDEDGYFVMHTPINTAGFSGDSFRMTVDPGTYLVVALANLGSRSTLSPDSPSLFDGYIEVTSDETGEQHYYAPYAQSRSLDLEMDYSAYKVGLPSGEVVQKELYFARSNRTVHIYIQGVEYLDTYTGGQVYTEFRNQPYKYDLLGNIDPGRKNYARMTETISTGNGNMLKTTFSTPLCPLADDMTIQLYDGGNNVQLIDEPINLKSWVEKNAPADTEEFDILVTFREKGEEVLVTVTLPDWENIGVKPGDL